MPFQQVSSSSWANDKKIFDSPETDEFVAPVDPEIKKTQQRWRGTNRKTVSKTIDSSPSHSTSLLAEQLAYEALHSREMQDTIEDLTSLNDERKMGGEITSEESEKVFPPTATPHGVERAAKATVKNKGHKKHKVQDNRRHNRHRKRGRKHRHPKYRLKRHRSEKESSKTARERNSIKSLNRGRRQKLQEKCNSEKSVTCRRKRDDQSAKTKKRLDRKSGSSVNVAQNSIEEIPKFDSTHKKSRNIPILQKGKKDNNDVIERKRSHIIANLMLTTTGDPTKKKAGDQGVEYSEYYSDNDNVLSPDIKDQSKMDEAGKTSMEIQMRYARQTGDENPLDQQYYDLSNEQLLEAEGERSKRNGEKLVRVMEDPSNSMEYVDNTYEPPEARRVVDNQYLNNYNYLPDQNAHRQQLGYAYNGLSNPSAEVAGMKQLAPNQISPNGNAMTNQNPPVIENLQNQEPSNMIPEINGNRMMNVAQRFAPGQSNPFGNGVLSDSPQSRNADGNVQYYSIREMPLQHYPISSTSPVASFMSTSPEEMMKSLGVNVPESVELAKQYAATSFVTGSSLSGSNPTLSYDNSGAASPRASFATFRMTSSPTDVSSTSVDSSELFSKFRHIEPEPRVPEFKCSSADNGAENTRGLDQIEPIASRETTIEHVPFKKGKKKGSEASKVHHPAAELEIKNAENHDAGKATNSADYNLSSVTVEYNSSETANTKLIANETKAAASEILNEIIAELEELKLENPRNEQREGLPCRLTGSWVTARAGVRIDMNVTNNSVHVSLDYLTPPIVNEGLLNVTWNVTGFAPFKRGGPFTLLATNNHTKTLAVFVGACKVCQGIDTIEGSWIISREPRDCRDFQMSTEIFNEIFRRTRLYSEIKDKQSKKESPTPSTSTVTASDNSSTSKSTNNSTIKVSDNQSSSNGTE